MRRLMKFLHTMGAIGVIGAMACLLVLLTLAPSPTSAAEYAAMRGAMAGIASWVFLPSMALTLVAGLLAIAVNPAFHNAGWAWAKLFSGVIVFEWGLVGVEGPMQMEAKASADALTGAGDLSALAASLSAEQNSLWILLGVATFNVVFGIWRPKLTRLRA
ncbi:MAG: hypothetical protein Q8M26_14195 [Pseudolabrys sp.]|nr:hypothetical protein [Pseudolabrys sp.]